MGKKLKEKAGKADAIIEEIKAGGLDEHLREIAEAAYTRAIETGSVKRVEKADPDKRKRLRTEETTETVQDTQGQPHQKWWPVKPTPVPPDGFNKGVAVEYKGNWYKRREFIGKSFPLPRGAYSNVDYAGMYVTITGMGEKSFKIDFPDSSPNGAKVFDSTGFVDLKKCEFLFDLNERQP